MNEDAACLAVEFEVWIDALDENPTGGHRGT